MHPLTIIITQPFHIYDRQTMVSDELRAPDVPAGADVLILVRSDEEVSVEKALRWIPLSRLYTRRQALLFYEVTDTEGPTE